MTAFEEHATRLLADLEAMDLLRAPREVAGSQGPILTVDGKRVVVLCSNNYLGLAGDPRLERALAAGLAEHGAGAGASRHVSGTSTAHRQAEQRLAAFVRLPRALLFATGYGANVGAIPALVGAEDAIFSDALNHASIVDGCRLSRADIHIFRHRDPEHLGALLASLRTKYRTALVVTESLFSMDGDCAPLRDFDSLCRRYDTGLYVDEAHALGVLGPDGAGLCTRDGVTPDVLVGTLGKALGLAGAFVAGRDSVVRLVENRARSYVFSTALPPAIASAAVTAADIVAGADGARARLSLLAARLREQLAGLGFRVGAGHGPILPVHIGPSAETMQVSRTLFELGVFIHGIRPPTVPAGTGRLRVTPMATHSDADLDAALEAFRRVAGLYQSIIRDHV